MLKLKKVILVVHSLDIGNESSPFNFNNKTKKKIVVHPLQHENQTANQYCMKRKFTKHTLLGPK